MYDELKEVDERAKEYKWSSKFTLREKIKIIMQEYLNDYENRELTRDNFISCVADRTAEIVYPEDEE